ncbi:MAG: response regulator [Phycisphaerae bacterium]|nr:response regulator [Phycisphaerae bacterium]
METGISGCRWRLAAWTVDGHRVLDACAGKSRESRVSSFRVAGTAAPQLAAIGAYPQLLPTSAGEDEGSGLAVTQPQFLMTVGPLVVVALAAVGILLLTGRRTRAALRVAIRLNVRLEGELRRRELNLLSLRASEQRQALAIEAARAAYFEYSRDRERIFVSPRCAEVLGYSLEALPSFHEISGWLDRRVHPDDREAVHHLYRELLQSPQRRHQSEFRLKDETGEWRWIQVHSSLGESGTENRTNSIAGIMFDITERKRVEEDLQESNRKLTEALSREKNISTKLEAMTRDLEDVRQAAEAATRSKSDFLANMSHEIRTPMTAILGFTENLLDPDLTMPEQIIAIHTIHRNGEYLLGIINDILDLSKVEAGKVVLERVACDPCKVVADVAFLVKVKADGQGLSFDTEVDGPIPETIQTDPTRLRQILINLVGNAIKFTAVGGVRLITSLDDSGDQPAMRFDVVDTGLGMSAEQVGRLFQPFVQADTSTTRKFGGTGLGLTISKRFAEMLGGDITVVETAEGVGTRFRVTVATGPLEDVKMIDAPAQVFECMMDQAARTTANTEQASLHGCRILIAEDGPDNQRLISFILKKAGAEVTVEENGKLAADTALAGCDAGIPFDVILMDMQMPVMDGYEATKLPREKGYTGPIIALTARGMQGDRAKCLNAGCDDYATKPVDRAKLVEMIIAQLDSIRST